MSEEPQATQNPRRRAFDVAVKFWLCWLFAMVTFGFAGLLFGSLFLVVVVFVAGLPLSGLALVLHLAVLAVVPMPEDPAAFARGLNLLVIVSMLVAGLVVLGTGWFGLVW